MQLFEFQGVEPNPRSYSVNQVADICKKEKIDVLLPIGGTPFAMHWIEDELSAK